MPYQANIPLANDRLSQSQQDINGNFQVLGSIGGNANANSAGLNIAPGAGFNYLYLPNNGATPPVGTAFANSNALYSSFYATSNQNEVFLNRRNQATVVQVPATASVLGVISNPGRNANGGWTMLPSGILIKWGYLTNATQPGGWLLGNNVITYPASAFIPAFAGIPFNVSTSLGQTDAAVAANIDINAIGYPSVNNNVLNFNLSLKTRDTGAANPIQLPSITLYWTAIGRGV